MCDCPIGPSSNPGIDQMDSRQGGIHKRATSVSLRGTDGVDGGEGSTMATDSPEQFESQKLMKETMEEGLKL